MPSSAEPVRSARPPAPIVLAAIALALAVEGLVAAYFGFPAFLFQRAALMVSAGWVIGAAGVVAWQKAPGSRMGPLLVAAAGAWFVGWLGGPAGWLPAEGVAGHVSWLWTALMGIAILGQPDGHLRTTSDRTGAVALVGVALVVPAGDLIPVAATVLGVVAVRRIVDGPDRRRGAAGIAGLLVAVGLLALPVVDVLPQGVPVNGWALAIAGPAAASVLLAADAIRFAPSPTSATDAVLRLSPDAGTTVVGELRRATGDPSLELGFASPDGNGFVDGAGRRLALPPPDGVRVATGLVASDGSAAIAIHDRRLETDAALTAATTRALALAAANARLQADLRAEVADVRASRMRLVVAAVEERAALEHTLEFELGPSLAALGSELAQLNEGAGEAGADALADARAGLVVVRQWLASLAEGLGLPAAQSGDLADALHRLVARAPVRATLSAAATTPGPAPDLPPTVVSTAWYVCSEALANVAKHAPDASVQVEVRQTADRVDVVVTDDGPGGADPSAGTGLRGLRDRVEAIGGTLRLESAGGGTRLAVSLPAGPVG